MKSTIEELTSGENPWDRKFRISFEIDAKLLAKPSYRDTVADTYFDMIRDIMVDALPDIGYLDITEEDNGS